MFDANMRHLPKGYEFFAEVHCLKENSSLAKAGVKTGDVLLCTMLSIGNKNPKVKVFLPDGRTLYVRSWDSGDEDELFDTWLVFSGKKDLSGFICDKEKSKARKYLKNMEANRANRTKQ